MRDVDLLTTSEAAIYLDVTRQAVHALTKPPYNLGRRDGIFWRFSRAELDAYRGRRQAKGGRRRDQAVSGPTGATVLSKRPAEAKERVPLTVRLDGAYHWAADQTHTFCGKRWQADAMVKPRKDVCPRCQAAAGKLGVR